jgi:hypothetical protein
MRRALLLVLTACGSTTTPSQPDAGPQPDAFAGFHLVAHPFEVSIASGSSATVTIELSPPSSTDEVVSVTTPAGVTADPLTVSAGSASGTLTLRASSTAATGVTREAVWADFYTGSLVIAVDAPHGVIDPAFADGQIMTLESRGGAMSFDDADNLYLTAGLQVTRYTTDGVLDTSFGQGGVASVPATASQDWAGIEAVADTTGVYVIGQDRLPNTSDPNIAVWKLTPGGALDSTFGTNGELLGDVGYLYPGSAIAAGGTAISIMYGSGFITPVSLSLASAAIDGSSFTTTTTVTPTNGFGTMGGILDGNGGAFFPGYTPTTSAVAHLLAAGVDTAFGTGGYFLDPAADQSILRGLFIAGGNEVAIGNVFATQGILFTILDPAGAVVSRTVLSVDRDYNGGQGGGVDSTGGIVIPVGGFSAQGMYVDRYLADGTLDPTYGVAGEVDLIALANRMFAGPMNIALDHHGRTVVEILADSGAPTNLFRLLP